VRRRRAPLALLLVALAALLVLRLLPRGKIEHEIGLPSPWSSPEACAAARTKLPRAPGVVRIGTWNLRWFPDGAPRPGGRHTTDVAWLACTIAWLDADLLAVQETKDGPEADSAMAELLEEVSRRTEGRWRRVDDRCPRDGREHLAILWDDARIEISDPMDVAALNPTGDECGGRLRPGLQARGRSRRGGLDFDVLDVHADSGRTARDRGHRAESVLALAATVSDEDRVVLGDWNTMGADEPAETAEEELAKQDAALAASFVRVAGPECSEYYRKNGTLLDAVYVSKGMSEARGASARLEGYCRRTECERLRGGEPLAYERLSDHCPIVVDLGDVDED
jgi:endonuclease/exonuclease/phosphatase family metal-dependent hydrolase